MTVAITPDACEYYTPNWILHRIYKCFDIDLDPCSPIGVKNVRANVHYTKEDDGLSKPWFGNVYMNCPYGRGINLWVNKLIESYNNDEVNNAIALLPVKSDTRWFYDLTEYAVCWLSFKGRIKFENGYDSDIAKCGTFASGLFLLTENIDIYRCFTDQFEDFGRMWAVDNGDF